MDELDTARMKLLGQKLKDINNIAMSAFLHGKTIEIVESETEFLCRIPKPVQHACLKDMRLTTDKFEKQP
jgi:hypothetical protein